MTWWASSGISGVLANNNVNILDISQTILQEIFYHGHGSRCFRAIEFSELKEQFTVREKKWACKLIYSMRIYSNTCTAFRNRDRVGF